MSRVPGSSQHNFAMVPKADIQRSRFNRSHTYKTAFNAGALIPVFVDEALPGDTFNLKMTAFARMSTPIHPIMDNLYLDSFFFAVPLRLVWSNFQKFMGEQESPGDSTDYLVPQMTASPTVGSIFDYMGIPVVSDADGNPVPVTFNALWNRAYALIWNEWFRDENLQTPVLVPTDDGPDTPSVYSLLPRGKRHDYFTSALPWPQKGPAVTFPLGGYASLTGEPPLVGKPWVSGIGFNYGNPALIGTYAARYSDGTVSTPLAQVPGQALNSVLFTSTTSNPSTAFPSIFSNLSVAGVGGLQPYANLDSPGVYADLSTATAVTVNQLRQAFQIQRLYERDARGGSRYTEILKSHFGVVSPDARLQRPEYLGGSSTPVLITPIAQTSATTTTPLANLSALGTVSLQGGRHGFNKSFVEHCVVIGLVSIRADLAYQQGLNRMFSRRTRFDFYWPALAHIGEQSILTQEIYYSDLVTNNLVFGYQERFAEYRYKPSLITGILRSGVINTLDSWHLAQFFATPPLLSSTFIVDNPPMSRIEAVPSQPDFIFDSYMDLVCARPMPTYSVPGLIDHF